MCNYIIIILIKSFIISYIIFSQRIFSRHFNIYFLASAVVKIANKGLRDFKITSIVNYKIISLNYHVRD